MSQTRSAPARPANDPSKKKKRFSPLKLVLPIFVLLLLGAGAFIVWQDMWGVRSQMVAFLGGLEPATRQEIVSIEARTNNVAKRETAAGEREAQLDAREADIAQREKTLQERTAAFEAMQLDPASPIEQQAEYLADLFSAMDPARAAELLEAMEDVDRVVRILRRMDDEYIVAILSAMDTPFGAEVSAEMLGVSGV